MTKIILYVVADARYLTSPFVARCYQGICHMAEKKHIPVMRIHSAEPLLYCNEIPISPPLLLSPDPLWLKDTSALLSSHGIKPITMGAQIPNISGVYIDTQAILQAVLAHLADAGFERIAFVGADRLDAYQQAQCIAFRAQSSHPSFFMDDSPLDGFFSSLSGFDALVCPNDAIALYLLAELSKRGQELAIVGCGNTLLSTHVSPTLTTTATDFDQLGMLAFGLWQLMQSMPTLTAFNTTLQSQLIIRQSTKHGCMKAFSSSPSCDNLSIRQALKPYHDLERCLQQADELDLQIIAMICEQRSYDTIADALYMTKGMVQYRMKKLFHTSGCKDKTALETLLHDVGYQPSICAF